MRALILSVALTGAAVLAGAAALPAHLGVDRPAAHAGLVHRRQVRHLHPLGRLLGARLRPGDPGQAGLRRVVLERADERQEAKAEPDPGRHVGLPPAAVRRGLRLPELRAAVPRRAVRPRPLGRRLPALRRQVRRADLEAPRGLRAVAQHARLGRPGAGRGTPSRSARSATCSATSRRPSARKGLQMGFYYSLYEWYNPLWLSDKPRYVHEHMFPQFKDLVTRYKPAHHLQRRRVGPALGRLAQPGAAGLAVQRIAGEGRSRRSTTAGARTRATSTAATGPPSTRPA